MRASVSVTLIFVIIGMITIGCSNENPISGGFGKVLRNSCSFPPSQSIFGALSTSDCDVATVIVGPNTGQQIGLPFEDENGRQWCVGTALVYNEPQNTYTGVFRFMGPSNNGPFGIIMPCGPAQDTRLLKVDACYVGDGLGYPNHVEWIEVCFVMQTRPTPNAHWRISVYIMRFNPTDNIPEFMDQQVWTFGLGATDDVHPDVAYDADTGNLVLVYSHWTTPGPQGYVPINYRYTSRNLSGPNPLAMNWSQPYRASANIPADEFHPSDRPNGWTPRLDIGWVDNAPGFPGAHKLVVIAYTGQYSRVLRSPDLDPMKYDN